MDQNNLDGLLKEGRAYGVIYGNRLANHLPMALIALDRMGADEEKMRTFAKRYSRKLEPLSYSDSTAVKNPLESLGVRDDFNGHLAFFLEQIKKSGSESVLSNYLPALFSGLSASAFHALIRLGYALEINDPEEIAFALAYWSSEFQALGSLGEASDDSPLEIMASCSEAIKARCFTGGIIIDQMVAISKYEKFQQAVCYPATLSLEQLSKLAIQAYLATDNFTLLHGVTGLFAFRLLQPYLSNFDEALKYFWQAFLIAFLSTKTTLEITGDKDMEVGDWKPILEKACQSNNDHVIKMVYTCRQEFQHSNNPDYFTAAQQVLQWDG